VTNGVVRKRARKKIKLPSGEEIFIPVLVQVNIVNQNGQEFQVTFDNTSGSNRIVHVDKVYHTDVDANGNQTGSQDTSASIDVERIDEWHGLDVVGQAQESKVLPDNVTGNDSTPPRFRTHQKTHVYRYYLDPNNADDNAAWVDSELIDELAIIDANGQEDQWILVNPFNGDLSGQADPNDPDITGSDGLDPPYRTDLLQNIVNYFDSPWIGFGISIAGGNTGVVSIGPFVSPQALGSHVLSALYMQGYETHRVAPASGSGTITIHGKTYNYSGLASFSPASGSLTAWAVCGFNTPAAGPFNVIVNAVRASASGSAYLQYPNATHPQAGWITALSVDIDFLAWNGTGPFLVYGSNPAGPYSTGMLTNATAAQVSSDDSGVGGNNFSIYEFGDVQGSGSQDVSGLVITRGSATWLPVAISLGKIGPLLDGFVMNNASHGDFTVLLKRQ
jgi:hypothetical protein